MFVGARNQESATTGIESQPFFRRTDSAYQDIESRQLPKLFSHMARNFMGSDFSGHQFHGSTWK